MSRIEEYFQDLVKSGALPQLPANYDAMTLKIYIDHLEAENVALRERLKKAVELPVNIGDVKYLISSDKSCVLEEKVIAVQATKYEYSIEVDEIDAKNQYGTIESFKIKQWNGDMFFKTREEAEARLAELKGGKE